MATHHPPVRTPQQEQAFLRETDIAAVEQMMTAEQMRRTQGNGGGNLTLPAPEQRKGRKPIELKPMPPLTWRSSVPFLRHYEYWQLQASRYPHIERSDEYTHFFLRGVTCHPRLSDYPMCKEIISDYFTCRDSHRLLSIFNVCAPLKEQMSACINEVFCKNHEKLGRNTPGKLESALTQKHETRMNRLVSQVQDIKERHEKLQD
jgi:hypothetical protein